VVLQPWIYDWEHLFETELSDAETHYSDEANRDETTASVVVFDSADTPGSRMQDHITEAWSQLAQSVGGIERTAYVAAGITAMAVKSNARPVPNSNRSNRSTKQSSGPASDHPPRSAW
jgi:superfamily II helicase